jgi:hypothetical protein
MLDPVSTQGITLGDWLTFFESLRGEQYLSLDGLEPISVSTDRATFEVDRTFHLLDGSVVPDPVMQEMVRDGEEWKLVMREALIEDILAARGYERAARTPIPLRVCPVERGGTARA